MFVCFSLSFKAQAFGLRSLDLSLVAAWSGTVALLARI